MSFDFVATGIFLPENWTLKRIGDVADINSDIIKKNDQPQGIFYIDISSVSTGSYEFPTYMEYKSAPSRAKRRLMDGDFIISTVRPNLKQFAILETVGRNWVASTGFCVVRAKDKKIVWYLYSFITSDLFIKHLVRVADGAAYPSFNPKEIEDAIIPWPPIEDLLAINNFAKTLDNKIELNRQTNQTLEQIAQAIFKSWFVDFDPTRAKIAAIQAGEDPERAAMVAISGKSLDELDQLSQEQLKTTAALFPDNLVDSELGEIPEGWAIKGFGEVSGCFDSKRVPLSKKKREEKKPGNIPYYGATSVMDFINEWLFDDIYLLLGEDGSVIKDDGTPFTQYICGKTWVNNHAHVLQGENGVSTEQLMIFIQNKNIAAYITGAVQLKLNQRNMNSIPFIDAGKEVNGIFYNFISPLYSGLRQNIEENKILQEIRDSLLPKLLSGDIIVPKNKPYFEMVSA